jgi:hypothetical protein
MPRKGSKKHHRRGSKSKRAAKKLFIMNGGSAGLLNGSPYSGASNVGAAPYAAAVYGNQDHVPGSNVIAMSAVNGTEMKGGNPDGSMPALNGNETAVSSGPVSLPQVPNDGVDLQGQIQTGGDPKLNNSRGGEGAAGLAVPAVLLVANQMMTRRRKSGKKHRRRSYRKYKK